MSVERPSPESLEDLEPARAAALWLERLQRDGAGDDDDAFQRWLAVSPANRHAWERATDLWEMLEGAEEHPAFTALRHDARSLRRPVRPSARVWFATAASLAVIATAAIMFMPRGPVGEPRPLTPTAAVGPDAERFGRPDYATAVGQRADVRLTDGTLVALDTNSAIDVAYGGGRRSVRLVRGQAFFNVARDPTRPFRVAAGGRLISDVGTRFYVRAQAQGMTVVLVEGAVTVAQGSDPAAASAGAVRTLAPGQQLNVRAGRPDAISRADLERASDWRRGLVQFDATPLSDVIAELNRYTVEQLVIRDPKVGALRVSGAFRTGDTTGFAQALGALYPLRLTPLGAGQVEVVARADARDR